MLMAHVMETYPRLRNRRGDNSDRTIAHSQLQSAQSRLAGDWVAFSSAKKSAAFARLVALVTFPGPSAPVTAGHIELLMVPALEVVHRCNYRFLEPMDVGNPRVGVCLHPFLR